LKIAFRESIIFSATPQNDPDPREQRTKQGKNKVKKGKNKVKI
jgi:hypothetical protein